MWDRAADDLFWVQHDIALSEADRMPLLRKGRLRRLLMAVDSAKADRSPAKAADDAARLEDAKRKAGQL